MKFLGITSARCIYRLDRYFTSSAKEEARKRSKLFLHVGPSGDSWIGDAIFAAKHNQPGYVKSILLIDESYNYFQQQKVRISKDKSIEDVGIHLIEVLDDHPEWAQEIYDTGFLPDQLKRLLDSVAETKSDPLN